MTPPPQGGHGASRSHSSNSTGVIWCQVDTAVLFWPRGDRKVIPSCRNEPRGGLGGGAEVLRDSCGLISNPHQPFTQHQQIRAGHPIAV